MIEKRVPLEAEEPRHRKKSKKRGQPRADHKHEYKTVLLYSWFDNPFKQGIRDESRQITKVCTVCGRIDTASSMRYIYEIAGKSKLDTGDLEKWYVDDYFDKFAEKMEEA